MVKKKVNKFNPVNWNWKKVGAYTGTALIAGLGVGFTVDNNNNNTIDKLQSDLADEQAKAPVVNTVEVEKIVEVDNGNLNLVLNHIYDNDGSVEYLTEDLDDDQISEIVDKVVFVNEVKSAAVSAVRADLYDEVDKLEVTVGNDTVVLDEDDLKRLRIDDDQDELDFEIDDWEDRDATVHVTGNFRQGTQIFDFELDAVFEDEEFDELDNIVVTARE